MLETKNREVILMCGTSGSGKTFISKQLEASGYIRLSLDSKMWGKYGESYMHLPMDSQSKLQSDAETTLIQEMISAIGEGRDVVVDQCLCKRSKRDIYRKIATKAGAEVKLVYCHADRDTLVARLIKRNAVPGPDSAIVSIEMLDRFLSGFQIPEPDEGAIDAEDFLRCRRKIDEEK